MKRVIVLLIAGFLFLSISVLYPSVRSEETVGNTLYVGGSGPGNYTKIQDAIDNISKGDTIFVYNGTYHENLKINRSLNLIGEDNETTVIDAKLTGKNAITIIETSNITISGFTISNASNGYGIECYWDRQVVISNCYVTMNRCGIDVWGDNNTVINCNILNNTEGIFLLSSYNNTIKGCKILNNSNGILLLGSDKNTIEGCNISNNMHIGMALKESCNNTIISCDLSNNKYGIDIQLSFPSYITDLWSEHFYSNGTSIIISTNNTIYHNNFINNSNQSLDTGKNNWDNGEHGNFWSDYNEMDKNNDGIGDVPYSIPGGNNKDRYPLMMPYNGTIRLKEFYINYESVYTMLVIGMIIAIIFLLPIAYVWYRKMRY